MKTSLILFLTLVILNLDLTKSKPHHTSPTQSKEYVTVPLNYFQSFSSFTQRQLTAPSYLSSILSQRQEPRVTGVSSNSFSLGLLYATLNEEPFDIETRDIIETIDAYEKNKPIDVYTQINYYLNQGDAHTQTTSALFTATDVPQSEGLLKLGLYTENVGPLENSSRVAQKINAYVANHTENLIVDQLLPTQDVPFYSSTAGVLVNTLSAQYKFRTPFTPGPNMEFRVSPEEALSVETLEVASVLKYHEGRETVVVIPLENSKRLILVKPDNFEEFTKKYLDNFVEYINTISSHPLLKIQYFKDRNVRVQVPVLNLTLARKFLREYEGTESKVARPNHSTSAICDTATDRKFFLQTPVEVSVTKLTAKSVDLAVAIGVQIDDVKEYRRVFGGVSSNPISSNNSNSFISITSEAPSSARLELDVSDGVVAVAEPEPEAEAEPLADEAVAAPVTEVSIPEASQPTKPIISNNNSNQKSNIVQTKTGSKLPQVSQLVNTTTTEDADASVAEPEPEPEAGAEEPSLETRQPILVSAPVVGSQKFASKLRSNLDTVYMNINKEKEQLIPVRIHSPVNPEDPMLFSRALGGDQDVKNVKGDQSQINVKSKDQVQDAAASDAAADVTKVKSTHADDEESQINVVFDSPFYMGIFDEGLGIYSFLAVRSPYVSAPHAAKRSSSDFTEYEKLNRWVCLAPPAPPALVAPLPLTTV